MRDIFGIEWEQISSGEYVQSEGRITTWVARFHKVGTEGTLRVEELMYFNSEGDIWE